MRYLISLVLTAAILATPGSAFGHGGGLDSYGGHNDRKSGTYHFHRGPLAGKSYSSKAAALRALRTATSPKPEPGADKEVDPATVIRKASTTKKVKALIDLLVKKGLIKEAELAAQITGAR